MKLWANREKPQELRGLVLSETPTIQASSFLLGTIAYVTPAKFKEQCIIYTFNIDRATIDAAEANKSPIVFQYKDHKYHFHIKSEL